MEHLDQVYLGTDKDGKDMYTNMFFGGAPKDAMSLIKRGISDGPIRGTAEFIVSKASPLLAIPIGLSANRSGSGAPISKKLGTAKQDGTEYTRVDQSKDQAKYVAGRALPISVVSTIESALTDKDHEYSYGDLLELAADLMGSPIRHQKPSGGEDTSTDAMRQFQNVQTGKSRFTIKGGK